MVGDWFVGMFLNLFFVYLIIIYIFWVICFIILWDKVKLMRFFCVNSYKLVILF